jgi:DNA polymerase I-like protein with 3'-5' exonuclease and polymerase domains
LKYLTYSYFGDIGYDDDVDMYLKAPERELEMYGDNAFNLIEKAPLDKLLTYNALDSLYTFKLWEEMSILFDDEKRRGNKFFLDSAITLCKAQENGFYIDEDVLRRNRIKLQEEMKDIEDEINHMDEVKLWDSDEPFSFQSNQQLAHLLFDLEKIKPLGYTKSGAPSVDKENLPKYNTPLVKKVLEWRSLEKITQYLDAYITEAVDKKIHPFFRLSSVDSFRSGCSSPNIQQIPKRNKAAKKYIRTGLKPHPGHRLVEHDHGQLEVRINACYSGDSNLIRYVTEGLDMHTESTMEAFLLTKDQMKKDYRNEIKGSFVFAEFYGSYYAQVAKDLWEFVETDEWLKGHLSDKGVKQYAQFEEQIKEAERILWTVRFPEHAEWRKDMWSFYNRHGYIETFTGFRIQGPMRRNNSFNGQVQGSAYHVLQQGMNWTMEEVEQKLEQTKLLVEIHDAMVATVPLHEEDMYDSIVYHNCTKKVVDKWPWIVVPLVMEKERSGVDGNWAEMTSCGVLHD